MTDEATVFVVDDNVGVRKSVGALLESAGLAVEAYAPDPACAAPWITAPGPRSRCSGSSQAASAGW